MKKKYRSNIFVASYKNKEQIKIILVTTIKIGNAVFRNRCRRRLKEAIRLFRKTHPINNGEYFFFITQELFFAEFEYIKQQVESCFSFLRNQII